MNIDYSKSYWKNDRVMLRLATVTDWEFHYPSYFDSQARFLLDSEIELPPQAEQDKKEWAEFVSPLAKHGRIVFAIENLNGGVVGFLNLNSMDERNGTFSVGMQIGLGQRGMGYGTAAMQIILDYAFNERRLHKYYGHINEGNVASAAMLKKLGCVEEGVRREMIYHKGRYWDEILFGLTADAFNGTT